MIYSNPKAPRRRLSLQILRIARELEALHILGECSVSTLLLAIGNLPPRPVCSRTILRDMEALEVAGLVERRKTITYVFEAKRKMPRTVYLWRLATPTQLRDRLQIIKGLTPKQIALLKEGKQIA